MADIVTIATKSRQIRANRLEKQLWWKVVIAFIAILTILGNIWVLILTWKERSLHQPNKYFIACLAVADLLVGVILIPLNVFTRLNFDPKSVRSTPSAFYLCRFMVWIDTIALATSIFSLTMISFDRYLKISKPLLYKSLMTTSRSLKIIFVLVFISISLASYSVTPNSGSYGILDTALGTCSHEHDQDKAKTFYLLLSMSTG
ncbi:adenosine receptor A2b-like [Dendronephthya gigantea]|uniref:adenosine receptor A2b-like n=1 Tax=Dendronephthya gigantea TaxID=151771 RepID=UPI00106B352B|nr:adenosine receptor A2b-like [Dendronephthya gigantea]